MPRVKSALSEVLGPDVKYEYTVMRLDEMTVLEPERFDKILDDMGEDGWLFWDDVVHGLNHAIVFVRVK